MAKNPRRYEILALLGLAFLVPTGSIAAEEANPRAVPTFECLGLYWTAPGGGESVACEARYRKAGQQAWHEALPLWFDSRNGEYRGSIVHLRPGTAFEVALSLKGTQQKVSLSARTWSDAFPVAATVTLPVHSDRPLTMDRSGKPDGYILYTHPEGAKTSTIDLAGQGAQCAEVKASYVILRGLTLKNPAVHGIRLLDGAHDVVIEECDISGWGRIAEDGWGRDYDGAIYSTSHSLARVVVQRNYIHHPRSNSNNWTQSRPRPGKREPTHPEGPQAVVFFDSDGSHVIRYNTIESDDQHQYNDVLGAGANFGPKGFPHRDSDIYGNLLSHCWDDAIESEGGNCNVRIWGNYLCDSLVSIACASVTVGPLYVWRNVGATTRMAPAPPTDRLAHGALLKTSDKNGGGKVYVFHNTILQPPAPDGKNTLGSQVGLGWGGPLTNVTSRNNILHVIDRGKAIVDRNRDPRNDCDYDLYNGRVDDPDRHQRHGIRGVPIYDPRNKVEREKGEFALAKTSPGCDAGVRIANFNDGFTGTAPDLGAHEAGTPPMEFGRRAYLSGSR